MYLVHYIIILYYHLVHLLLDHRLHDNQPPGVNISVQNGSLCVGDVTIELDKIDSESGVREVNLYEITGMLCFVYLLYVSLFEFLL